MEPLFDRQKLKSVLEKVEGKKLKINPTKTIETRNIKFSLLEEKEDKFYKLEDRLKKLF